MSKKYETFYNMIKCSHLPYCEREYKFHPVRKWRIDFAFPDYKLAIEIEGAVWVKGRHTRGSGFTKDMEKYNNLTLLGWKLLRFTPQQVKNGEALNTIFKYFEKNELDL